LKTLNGQLFTAPIDLETKAIEGQAFDILDVGCGSGSWAIDLARQYPHLRILGVDITPPILPDDAQTSNVTFLKADLEQDWYFAANTKFRYIHGRMLHSGIHDWPALLHKCSEHLAPEGWLEVTGIQLPFRCDGLPSASAMPPFVRFGYAIEEAWKSNGLDFRATSKHEERLKALGFQNVSDRTVRWPLGSWDKAEKEEGLAGDMILANFSKFIAAAGTAILDSGKAGEGYAPMSAEVARELVSETTTDVEANWKMWKYWLCMYVSGSPS
jgi:SAM-dependent methyltransferase